MNVIYGVYKEMKFNSGRLYRLFELIHGKCTKAILVVSKDTVDRLNLEMGYTYKVETELEPKLKLVSASKMEFKEIADVIKDAELDVDVENTLRDVLLEEDEKEYFESMEQDDIRSDELL